VAKPDKVKTMIIINRDVLRQKVHTFIQNNGMLQLNKDQAEHYQQQISQVLQKCDKLISKNQHTYLLQMKPNTPELNALINTHKINSNPIRPAINSIKAPSYKLARFLNKQLDYLIALPYTHAIKNSAELA
jgi:hypothetical protein